MLQYKSLVEMKHPNPPSPLEELKRALFSRNIQESKKFINTKEFNLKITKKEILVG